jgi:hypothetical protein
MEESITLDRATVQEAEQVAQDLNISVAEVYSQAIQEFAAAHTSVETSKYSALFGPPESWHNSFELAKKYIDQEGSGIGNLSTTYKQRIKEKIAAKLNTRRLRAAHSAL